MLLNAAQGSDMTPAFHANWERYLDHIRQVREKYALKGSLVGLWSKDISYQLKMTLTHIQSGLDFTFLDRALVFLPKRSEPQHEAFVLGLPEKEVRGSKYERLFCTNEGASVVTRASVRLWKGEISTIDLDALLQELP